MPEDRKKGSRYSPQIKERAIAHLKESNFTSKEIAQKLNVDYNTIRLWMRKAGLKKTKRSAPVENIKTRELVERNETIYNLYFFQKTPQTEIAARFGISKQRVKQILEAKIRRVKIPPNLINLMARLKDIYSLDEASTWADINKAEFDLKKVPNAEVLKAAAQDGRLAAVKKGSVWLTSESELRIYLANYHPGRGGHRRIKKNIPSED